MTIKDPDPFWDKIEARRRYATIAGLCAGVCALILLFIVIWGALADKS